MKHIRTRLSLITKGDANPIEDFYPVSCENIIGKVVFYSYPLGVFMGVMSNPIVFITCIIIPMAALLIYSVIKTYLAAKEIAMRQEEERVGAALERIKEKQEK